MIDIYPISSNDYSTSGQLKNGLKTGCKTKAALCIVHKKPMLNMKTAILKLR